MKKRISIIIIAVLLLFGVVVPDSNNVNAATFSQINENTMFFLQQSSVTCTLASAAMMVRRASRLNGSSNWNGVTENSMSSAAWTNNGLKNSFSYNGINVSCAGGTSTSNLSAVWNNCDKAGLFRSLLSQHPEGVVMYCKKSRDINDNVHAILLTDYTDGSFYCADPAKSASRIPLSNATVQMNNAFKYWYVSSPSLSLSVNEENPIGCFDIVTSTYGNVFVRGWAFDPSDISKNIQIHVYIGGASAGEGVEIHGIYANTNRKDVDNDHKCGENHGFDATISTGLSGEQQIYIYAINIGSGENQLIGTKTVYIPKDETKPVINDIKIINQSITGYTVQCTVSDSESGIKDVKFPTWTNLNDQDDISWESYTSKDGDTYYYDVKRSAHNYELGLYNTHIYAYDNQENVSISGVNYTFLGTKKDLGTDFYGIIRNVETQNVLQIEKGGDKSSNVAAYTFTGIDEQIWYFTRNINGSYRIQNKAKMGFSLDVSGGVDVIHTNIQIYENNDSTSQQWNVYEIENNLFFVPELTNSKSLDLENSSTENGANIQLFYLYFKSAGAFEVIMYNETEKSNIDGFSDETDSVLQGIAETIDDLNHVESEVFIQNDESTESGKHIERITGGNNYPGTNSVTGNVTTPNTTVVSTVPKIGTKLTDTTTKASYKVTKAGKSGGAVAYVGTTNKKATSVTIPATVKIDGITYKVTSIGNGVFQKNTKLKSITIEKNVTSIGKKAFYGCKNLKTINIKSTNLKTVGANAFKGIHAKAKIKVPKKKLKSYKKLLKGKGQGKKVKIQTL